MELASLAGRPAGGGQAQVSAQHPPPFPACAASTTPCYGQDPLHRVYHLGNLYAHGITGTGTAVAVIIPGANPWLRSDLAVFSRHFHLPNAQADVINWGRVPPARPDASSAYWAQEGTADAELVHFIAPGARLVYLQLSPDVSNRAAMGALGWLATHRRIDVASFSWGTFEADIAAHGGYQQILALRAGLVTAAHAGVSVIAGSGDSGPTGISGHGYFPHPTVAWPTSDPLVTGVGALSLHLDAAGRRVRPDSVLGGTYASGAGLSAAYPRPAYQNLVASTVGSHRGVVDVSMNGCMWVYLPTSHRPPGPAWQYNCGTSFSAPLFAGITALAAQQAGHPLGPLGPALYRMHGVADGILDVTHGNNTSHGVKGYSAGPGYDLPSGIGTIASAPTFTATLARLAAHR